MQVFVEEHKLLAELLHGQLFLERQAMALHIAEVIPIMKAVVAAVVTSAVATAEIMMAVVVVQVTSHY